MKKNTQIGDIYMVTYEDASYSYQDIVKENNIVPGLVVSIGKVRRAEDSFLDLEMIWVEGKDKNIKGIIIPKKAILKIEKLREI